MFKKKKKAEAAEGEEAEKKEDKKEEKEAEAPKKEGEEGEAEGEGEGAPKKGKKKLIIIAGVVLLLVIGGAVFALMGGKKEPKLDEHGNPIVEEEELSPEEKAAKEAAAHEASKPVFYELPEFLVNLNPSGGTRVSFLKMSVTLELRDKEAVVTMDNNKPRIQDIFNTYLRELRPSDIQGSAGIYRLRTELMTRLNGTIEEGAVKDILFGEIIVQ